MNEIEIKYKILEAKWEKKIFMEKEVQNYTKHCG